ncbi:hypothetical protein HU200_015489 [Digitaria exilis]|uniref:DUF569 domain-containing protein n=1 Tax=Digitaria exilis TaxID=1010633 RepID=A0A835FAK7_9POAL|nr:hypothetical protein HU200_015489 [Digitaria exilis]
MVLWRTTRGTSTPTRSPREGSFIFYGRSVFQLTGVQSILLRESVFSIRLCTIAMDIVVLTAGSPEAAPAAGDGASPQRDARAAAEPHARVYLHADEDGERVSLRPHRASLNTAWRVHRVRQAGDDYVLLQSAAYGRYLATSPHQVSLAYAGHAAIQVAYDAPEQDDVVWEAVRVADDTDDVLMLRVSNRVLRAPPPGTQSCRPPSTSTSTVRGR